MNVEYKKNLLEEKYNILCNRINTPVTIPTVTMNYDLFEVSSIPAENKVQPDVFLKNANWLELITSTFDHEHEIVFHPVIVSDEKVLKQANILFNLLKTRLMTHLNHRLSNLNKKNHWIVPWIVKNLSPCEAMLLYCKVEY